MHISTSHWLAVPQAERTLRAWRGPCSDLQVVSQCQAPRGVRGIALCMDIKQLRVHNDDCAKSSLSLSLQASDGALKRT